VIRRQCWLELSRQSVLRPIRFYGLSRSDFGPMFITQQAQVDVNNVEGVKLF
jgi:hypothetical protein